MLDALAAFGAPEDVVSEVSSLVSPDEFEVDPENAQALNAFLSLASCWDWLAPPMGKPIRIGIRSTEIESTLRLMGIKGKRRLRTFDDIRVMEGAALKVFHS